MSHTNVDEGQAKSGRWEVDVRDLVAGALLTGGGLILFFNAQSMEESTAGNQQLGPAVFPLFISGLLTVLGIMLVATAALRRKAPPLAAAPEPESPGSEHHVGTDLQYVGDEMHHLVDEVHDLMEEDPVPFKRLLLVLGIFVAYLLIFIPLGFIVSTFLFMTVLISVVAPEKWLRNVLVALGVSLFVYFTFGQLLGVELPVGILG